MSARDHRCPHQSVFVALFTYLPSAHTIVETALRAYSTENGQYKLNQSLYFPPWGSNSQLNGSSLTHLISHLYFLVGKWNRNFKLLRFQLLDHFVVDFPLSFAVGSVFFHRQLPPCLLFIDSSSFTTSNQQRSRSSQQKTSMRQKNENWKKIKCIQCTLS